MKEKDKDAFAKLLELRKKLEKEGKLFSENELKAMMKEAKQERFSCYCS